jgi:septum formation topological specificity factor MinE
MPKQDEGPFLKEERKLLNTISERLSHFIMQRRLEQSLLEMERIKKDILENRKAEWKVILELLSSTDQNLLIGITRKMMNYLCRSGISQACILLQKISIDLGEGSDENQPAQKKVISNARELTDKTFVIAEQSLSDEEILFCIQKWIKEDKSSFLVNTLENPDSLITEIADAIRGTSR